MKERTFNPDYTELVQNRQRNAQQRKPAKPDNSFAKRMRGIDQLRDDIALQHEIDEIIGCEH